jgi:TPR repeat protein
MATQPNGGVASARALSKPSAAQLRSARWLMTILLMGGGAGFWLAGSHAVAQESKSSARILVASQLRLSPGTQTKLELGFAPKDAIPPRSVVVIRGVPASLRLSEGRPFGPGVWVIPAAQFMSITVETPPGANAGGVLTLALTTLEGASIAEAHITLVTASPPVEIAVAPAPPPANRDDIPTAATQAKEQKAAPLPKLTAESHAQSVMLLEMGRDSLRDGNIQHARQFYLRAAEKGLAEAALALAATYDPVELSRMKGVVGVVPDAKLARKWYEQARQLGSPDAASRLSALSRP